MSKELEKRYCWKEISEDGLLREAKGYHLSGYQPLSGDYKTKDEAITALMASDLTYYEVTLIECYRVVE